MYFSSELGKAFIITDNEEVTGVISVRYPSKKKSLFQSPDTIKDTLKKGPKENKVKRRMFPISYL